MRRLVSIGSVRALIVEDEPYMAEAIRRRPAPPGDPIRHTHWTGYDECLAGWQGLAADPSIRLEVEHVDVDGDRAVIRWRVTGAQNDRGVDLVRVRDGKIVEALGDGERP